MTKINPFMPGDPVAPGMFVGRIEELQRFSRGLQQTTAGHSENYMIIGERGIGKTSFFNIMRYCAKGDISITNETFNFLVIDTDITKATTQLDLIKKIRRSLKSELGNTEKSRNFLRNAWEFLQGIEVSGFRITTGGELITEEVLVDEFSYSLNDIFTRICNKDNTETTFSAHYDGVLILIDESDNASENLNLGSFLKLLSERLQRKGFTKFCLCIAGLPNVKEILIKSHESSIRLFHELPLNRLSKVEVADVVKTCIKKSNEESDETITITDEGLSHLVNLSEGYPHFIQQFGYSAFEADSDNIIDENDVMDAAFNPSGALEEIGNRYYRNNFYNKIKGENYRQVLRIMAEELDSWVPKSKIRKDFKGSKSTLNNAIRALRNRGIILSKHGERGVYRLQHKGFAYWIKLYGTKTLN